MTATAEQITNYAHARAALAQDSATPEQLRTALASAAAALRLVVGAGVRKTDAAALLGISRQALEKWITQGRIRTVPAPSGSRALVDADQLAELLVEVERLRELGTTRATIAAALHQLAQRDPQIQAELDEMLAPGLAALERDDLAPVTIPSDFADDD